jgi:hypothetical protein
VLSLLQCLLLLMCIIDGSPTGTPYPPPPPKRLAGNPWRDGFPRRALDARGLSSDRGFEFKPRAADARLRNRPLQGSPPHEAVAKTQPSHNPNPSRPTAPRVRPAGCAGGWAGSAGFMSRPPGTPQNSPPPC